MAEFPALPLFTDAYLGDTRHLSTIEHGAYLLLLIVAWRSKETCLPDDDAKLAKYVGMTRGQWTRIAPTIREFFTANKGSLYQSRLTDEANRVRQVRDSQAAAGRASALKRNGRHSTERNAKREQSDALSANQNPTPSPIPTIIEPSGSSPIKSDDSDALSINDVVDAWNANVAGRYGLPRCVRLSPSRKAQIRARLRDSTFEEMDSVFGAFGRSAFLRGERATDGRANKFDIGWVMKADNFAKVLEGKYDD